MRAIVAVDTSVTLASADEDESEAVALACVEFLLAETNAYYSQHVLARRTVQRLSDHLASNIMDAVCAAVLRAEAPLATHHFEHEADPFADTADRHAVRTLPCRSPERVGPNVDASGALGRSSGGASSPSRDSRTSSSPEKLALHASGAVTRGSGIRRARRRADKAIATAAAATAPTGTVDRQANSAVPALPEILVLPEDADENPDTKVWRAACLKQLTTSSKKLSSFSKWATVARAFAPSGNDPKVSMEVEITESTPPLLQRDVLSHSTSATSGIKMKSNVDSFAAISDVASADRAQGSSRSLWPRDALLESHGASSSVSLVGAAAKATSTSSGNSTKASATTKRKNKTTTGNGAVLLNDKLSRKKSAVSGSASPSTLFGSGASIGSSASQAAFVPEQSDFNASALPSTIQLARGVVLSQGDSVVEGPVRIESPNTMSRKRFDLHQSLATDLLLHWNDRDVKSRSVASSAGSPGFYHHAHDLQSHVRPYEEVPAEPIPAPPYLSPIATAALAIPRTHLAQSLSTPALRVRSPTHSAVTGRVATASTAMRSSASTAAMPTQDALLAPAKHRPRTALAHAKTPASSTFGGKSALGRSGSAAAAKYQREFPKPQAGVVTLSQVDESQRLAWISP